MKKITNLVVIIILILSFGFSPFLQGQYYFSTRTLTRGADTAELYLNCLWYYDLNQIPWNGLFHSTDNGKSFSVSRKLTEGEGFLIFGDSVPGGLFMTSIYSQDTFGISFDYGATYEKKYFNDSYYSAAGCMAGEIYMQGFDLFRSDDYGNSFCLKSTNDSLTLREVGTLPGELYCYKFKYQNGPLGLAYSNNYGQTFTVSYIQFPGFPVFDECMIYRGTEPGEIYFVLWALAGSSNIYLFHTFDYGQTITYQSKLPWICDENIYTAGRTPGSFYVVLSRLCGNPYFPHSCLEVYFSRDYGQTFTMYYHDLDSTYTGNPSIPPPVKNFSCYPNPASDKLSVEFHINPDGADIELFNLTCQYLIHTTIPANRDLIELDIGRLKAGLYILKVVPKDQKPVFEKVVVR